MTRRGALFLLGLRYSHLAMVKDNSTNLQQDEPYQARLGSKLIGRRPWAHVRGVVETQATSARRKKS
jgi:hypothetical protein